MLILHWRVESKEARLCILRLQWGLKTKQNKNSLYWQGSEVREETDVVAVRGRGTDFPRDSFPLPWVCILFVLGVICFFLSSLS